MFVYLEVQLIFTQSNSPSSILFMNKFRKERNGAYFVKKKKKKKDIFKCCVYCKYKVN